MTDKESKIAWQVMVSSHERSGTHFLINSIAANSDYEKAPLINFDVYHTGKEV